MKRFKVWHNSIASALACVMGIVFFASPAMAQGVDKASEGEPAWRTVIVAIVLLIAVLAGSFVGAKRPHSDD